MKTVCLGGNAVIATDIDYGEVGGAKAMLMVCMTGTAVLAGENCLAGDNLGEDRQKIERWFPTSTSWRLTSLTPESSGVLTAGGSGSHHP